MRVYECFDLLDEYKNNDCDAVKFAPFQLPKDDHFVLCLKAIKLRVLSSTGYVALGCFLSQTQSGFQTLSGSITYTHILGRAHPPPPPSPAEFLDQCFTLLAKGGFGHSLC